MYKFQEIQRNIFSRSFDIDIEAIEDTPIASRKRRQSGGDILALETEDDILALESSNIQEVNNFLKIQAKHFVVSDVRSYVLL